MARRAHLDEDGVWCRAAAPEASGRFRGRPALFLDRDGTVVEETGYLHRPEDVRLIQGAGTAIAAANRAGVPIVMLTNQSGIGRGLYGWDAFEATQARILEALAEAGARIDLAVACPFHPEGRPPYRAADHPCRKPRPGMLLRAAERLGLDLAASWIVGDRALDLAAGRAAALAGGVLVQTGYGAAERAAAEALAREGFRVLLRGSVAAAAEILPFLEPPAD